MEKHRASGLKPQISRATVTSWALVSFLVAYAGPFGTYAVSFGWRLLYWSLVVVCASVMSRFCAALVAQMAGRVAPFRIDLLIVGLMTLLFTPALWGITLVVLEDGSGTTPQIWVFAQYVAIVSVVITVARRTVPGLARGAYRHALAGSGLGWGAVTWAAVDDSPVPRAAPVPVPVPVPAPVPPRLVRRLPDAFEGPILRLTVNDHFVDVVTAKATHRIRLRFADAIDEMDTVEGYCTHRSHWVARQAIAAVSREPGRITLRLSNGDLVPVSRTYRPGLEQAGIL